MAEFYSWPSFWWRNITGPRFVLDGVVDNIIKGRNVILNIPEDLPWSELIHTYIDDLWKQKSKYHKGKTLSINLSEEEDALLTPGRFLLNRCAKESSRHGWREHSKQSIADYIIKEKVFNNTLIWINDLCESNISPWVDFVDSYKTRGIQDGLFILVYRGKKKVVSKKNLVVINYGDYVDKQCVRLFSSFILSERHDYSELWKNYISSVVSELCDTDAEVAYALMQHDFKKIKLYEEIDELAKSSAFMKRGITSDSQHLLRKWRDGDSVFIEKCIWKAQLSVFFSEIELERSYFVNRYYDEIKESISIEDVVQYGFVLDDVYDVELGTMCYLLTDRPGSNNQLDIRDQNSRDRIVDLHRWRNMLAHGKVLSEEEVIQLIDGIPSEMNLNF